MADLTGLVPNFGMKTFEQRLADLKQQAESQHKTWYPEVGEVIAGEVLAFNSTKLIIKTADIPFLNVVVYSHDLFEDKNGCDIFEVGSLIALTFHGEKPPRGFKNYSVVTEK